MCCHIWKIQMTNTVSFMYNVSNKKNVFYVINIFPKREWINTRNLYSATLCVRSKLALVFTVLLMSAWIIRYYIRYLFHTRYKKFSVTKLCIKTYFNTTVLGHMVLIAYLVPRYQYAFEAIITFDFHRLELGNRLQLISVYHTKKWIARSFSQSRTIT